ncbi:MAG: type II toxin-antitoxin system PemK/MazF family toxin [Planctomycetia bacterium]|nr:type II toxin-antitoxin system PemK/MazF family toxin [Planctomycetia bacterium]
MRLQQGSIVWVTVIDQAGRNPKCRPAVVLTPTNEIEPGESVLVAAATSTFPSPLPTNHVELPWHRSGHPVTGLNRRCAVVCDWIQEVRQSAIVKIGGIVPTAQLAAILAQIPADPDDSTDAK